jgi:hypothetical protein
VTPKKTPDTPEQMTIEQPKARKSWIKKTPLEAVKAQIQRLREGLEEKEEEFKETKRQLKKLEEVEKLLGTE